MTAETLPIVVAVADTQHHLIVTLTPLSEDEQADYDELDPDERSDIDRDRTEWTIECPGVTTSCHGWIECMADHDDITEEDRDDGEATSHGVFHQHFHFGWAVETGQCSLLAFPDATCDSGSELAVTLGAGRHPIDYDWDDEYVTLLHAVSTS